MTALSLFVTIGGFLLGALLNRRFKTPLINPVVFGVVGVLAYLALSHLPYAEYARHTQPISGLLAPAVVALALPLHERTALLRQNARAIAAGILCCCLLAAGLGWAVARALHFDPNFTLALSSRSATAPIAMAVAQKLGRVEALSGAIAILTGMTGATLGPLVLNALRVRAPLARGLAIGAASHGIGTARIREEGPDTEASAALGMCLNSVLTAVLLALVWRYLPR